MSSSKNRPLPQSLGLPFTGADSHAHLDDERLFGDLPGVLERAAASGVSLIVHMFLLHERYAEKRNAILEAASRLHSSLDICFARGVHPEDILRVGEEEWEALADVVKNDPLVKAIGEIGLDYHYDEGYSPPEMQKMWFRRQLHLAKEFNKPVVIHSRDAWDDTFAILDEENMEGWPLLWHCFGGDRTHAEQIMERGWHIAFGGAATFKANEEVRAALHAVLPDRLMLETDCPYLAPIPWRGRINEPALTVFTAECLARELGMKTEELWTLTGQNTRRFFGMQH